MADQEREAIECLAKFIHAKRREKDIWMPVTLTAAYTLAGPKHDVFATSFFVWGYPPFWYLNGVSGWIVAQHCEVYAWWRRLVLYGTAAEHAAACTMAAWLSATILG